MFDTIACLTYNRSRMRASLKARKTILLVGLPILLASCVSKTSASSQSETTGSSDSEEITYESFAQDPVTMSKITSAHGTRLTYDDRHDPVLDPYFGRKPEGFTVDNFDYQIAHTAKLRRYFDDDYQIIPCGNTKYEGKQVLHYIDTYWSGTTWKAAFFDSSIDPYMGRSTLVSPFINGIYAGGVWSYAILRMDEDEKLSVAVRIKNQLCAIYEDVDSFPYDVYYNSECVYFMSKDPSFPKDYLKSFKQSEKEIYRL
jgi:hypothetical protein